jgi:hypothetical protein
MMAQIEVLHPLADRHSSTCPMDLLNPLGNGVEASRGREMNVVRNMGILQYAVNFSPTLQ